MGGSKGYGRRGEWLLGKMGWGKSCVGERDWLGIEMGFGREMGLGMVSLPQRLTHC